MSPLAPNGAGTTLKSMSPRRRRLTQLLRGMFVSVSACCHVPSMRVNDASDVARETDNRWNFSEGDVSGFGGKAETLVVYSTVERPSRLLCHCIGLAATSAKPYEAPPTSRSAGALQLREQLFTRWIRY